MRSQKLILTAAVCVSVLGLGALEPSSPPLEPSSHIKSVSDKRPLVLTTFTISADMVRQVAGDMVQVESIVKPGAQIHGYEPTPSDLTRSQQASLIIDNGFGLEAWLERFITPLNVPTVTLTEGIDPIMINRGHNTNIPNPHAWMSPLTAHIYISNIQRALTQLVPEAEQIFTTNANAYAEKLDRIATEFGDALAKISPQKRVLVTCEGAFSYLAHDFGLQEKYLWPVNQENDATPRRVVNLINTVRQQHIPAVFCESTVNPVAQNIVADESGARFGGVLYVDSLAATPPLNSYLALLKHDTHIILEGLK